MQAPRNPAAPYRHLDLTLLLSTLGIALVGVLMVYSATRQKQETAGLDPAFFLKRQAVFLLLGLVAMAQLIKPRMPRLGTAAALSGFIGALGFLGLHAVSIVDAAAAQQPDRAAMVALLQDTQSSPLALLVLVPFLIAMPLSVLLSSIGFLRTRVVHRWIPAALLLFLVLDFGQFPTGPVDPHWLFVAAAVGVAAAIARRTDRQWWLGDDTTKN